MHLIMISESDLQEAQAFQEVVLVNVLDLMEAFFILKMLGFHCFHLVQDLTGPCHCCPPTQHLVFRSSATQRTGLHTISLNGKAMIHSLLIEILIR